MNKEVFKRKWQPTQTFNVIYIICWPDLLYTHRERGVWERGEEIKEWREIKE